MKIFLHKTEHFIMEFLYKMKMNYGSHGIDTAFNPSHVLAFIISILHIYILSMYTYRSVLCDQCTSVECWINSVFCCNV